MKPGKQIRLNKYLADSGLGSRRKVEQLILAGRITINGEVCVDLAMQVDSSHDLVEYEGETVKPDTKMLYIAFNKPRGYIVTQHDEHDRKTIYSLLPDLAQKCNYAGRLDKNSEGLLLITNDGDLINKLTHPKSKVEKVYKVDISPRLNGYQLEQLRRGVEIDGGKTYPAGVFVKKDADNKMTLKMVITEGKKRQIRLMIETVGAKVHNLKRLQFGPLKLGKLEPGMWRPLTVYEVRDLKRDNEKGKIKK
ncbi:MAG: ribosomal large subunit pseudouridine synthase B [Candidatus Cloacimonetes bacterium HGW-Cloacimonetes-1]|nr:MAG: ribosomal large subunit pseudouridine synthase B [Candidatus Cloacimonetes bacterium HGW-Cloacimonetes-1]